jgi:ribose 5-phosphate isomerase B
MIALASDHAGFQLKEKIKRLLDELHLEYEDFGPDVEKPCDYPDYAYSAAKSVGSGRCDRGILCCGSGIGVDMVANKVSGVRSALCTSVEMADLSRRHNDANVLSLGGRLTAWEMAERIIRVWLTTPFEGGRHKIRVDKIHSLSGY